MKLNRSSQMVVGVKGAIFSLFVFPSLLASVAFSTFTIANGLAKSLTAIGGLLTELGAAPTAACDLFIYVWTITSFAGFILYGLLYAGSSRSVVEPSTIDDFYRTTPPVPCSLQKQPPKYMPTSFGRHE